VHNNGCLIEQGLTSHQTHYRSYRGRIFTSQKNPSPIWPIMCIMMHKCYVKTEYSQKVQKYTTMVPCLPWFLWNAIMSLNGKSQIMSLLRTKNGSEFSNNIPRARARGPAASRQTQSNIMTVKITDSYSIIKPVYGMWNTVKFKLTVFIISAANNCQQSWRLLSQTAVFCKRQSKVLPNFVFKVSTFHFQHASKTLSYSVKTIFTTNLT